MNKSGHVRANSQGETESRRTWLRKLQGAGLVSGQQEETLGHSSWVAQSLSIHSGPGGQLQGHFWLPGLAEHWWPQRCPHSTNVILSSLQTSTSLQGGQC